MRFKIYYIAAVLFTISLLSACNARKADSLSIGESRYAKFFKIEVNSAGDTSLLLNENFYTNNSKYTRIQIDSSTSKKYQRIICMSTSHIAFLEAIGKLDCIIAISGGRYVYNNYLLDKIRRGEIEDIGYESSLNYERILALKPDIVFTYGISGENNSYIDKLRQLGVNVMVIGDFNESHPLGKLEYIKLFGLLTGESSAADSIFAAKERIYNQIKATAASQIERPKILINAPWKDSWYVPGEENYMTALINDAGGRLLGSRSGVKVSSSHSVEEIFKLASNADYWLNPNSYRDLATLISDNPLFKGIKAVKEKRVYNNIKKNTAYGGSDFWEKGVIEPEVVLKDLVKILHPDLFPGYTPQYYMQLR